VKEARIETTKFYAIIQGILFNWMQLTKVFYWVLDSIWFGILDYYANKWHAI